MKYYIQVFESKKMYFHKIEAQNLQIILNHVTAELENNSDISKVYVYQEVGTYREFPIWQQQFQLKRKSNQLHRLAQEHHGFELRFYDAKETHHQAIFRINNKLAKIDKPCLDLVLLFNELNIPTKFCCQGNRMNPYHIIFEVGTPMSVFESFTKNLPLKGTFKPWRNGRGDESVKYVAPSIEAAAHDFQLIKAFANQKGFLTERRTTVRRRNNMQRTFDLQVLLRHFRKNRFDCTHEIQEDNNIVNINFNNSNIKHIEIDIKHRKASITRVNDEETMYFFVYHNDLFDVVLQKNNIRL